MMNAFHTATIRFEDFRNPPTYFRPAPFWSINDEITPEETARQMSDMRSVGLSGGFFHARAGLKTPYMGEAWFAAMRAALEVAEKEDGYLWLYDEDMWPSGAAGGEVARANPEYRKTMLEAELLPAGTAPVSEGDRTVRAAYRVERDGVQLKSVTQLSADEAKTSSDGERLVLYKTYARESGQWGWPYANLLHPGAVQEFIRTTHAKYAKELGHAFGKRIPGIFTDEPNIIHQANSLPWYEGLVERYAKENGRDLIADLPLLFLNGEGSRKVRLLVRRVIANQYVESFSKAIFDWCEKHNIAYTGHYNDEDALDRVLHNHSGNLMAHYRYQQIPGIDHLFRRVEIMLLTAKCAMSVARQLGRKQVLSEIFGGMRHSAPFSDFRWLGNYDLAMGVNCFCPHLSWYTMAGRRKRDWPQNFNYQQTYWRELTPLHDYLTRMSAVLTQGKAQVEMLMLHPMDAVCASHRFGVKSAAGALGEDMGLVNYHDRTLRRLLGAVLMAGYECDLGDEDNLAEFGKVDAGRLKIGEMAYRVVIVPPALTWRPGTYELLKQFSAAGGTIIFTGDTPTELDAEPAGEKWDELVGRSLCVPASGTQLLSAVDRVVSPAYRLWSDDGRHTTETLVQHRADGKRHLVFVANIAQKMAQRYEIAFAPELAKEVAIWDGFTGKRQKAEVIENRVRFELSGGAAILLVAGEGAADGAEAFTPAPDLSRAQVKRLPGTWKAWRDEPNVLVMDRVSFSTDGGKTWSQEMLESAARRELAKHFGTEKFRRLQPWRLVADGHAGVRGQVVIRYRFNSEVKPKSPAWVVVERMNTLRELKVNGQVVDHGGGEWIWDRAFGKAEVSGQIRTGENVVEATLDYDVDTEIEAAYIAGDFGVRLNAAKTHGELVAESPDLKTGSWVDQGYPFYTGRMVYKTTVQHDGGGRVFVRIPAGGAVLFKVRVNGKEAGTIAWAPYHLELTDHVRAGENALEIEVICSRQNLTGGLHEKEGEETLPGPFSFEEPWFLRPQFSLVDCGLINGAELLLVR